MGPRNAYKDMLDNVVSPIACVSMNHQNQLEQMANGAMFATPGDLVLNPDDLGRPQTTSSRLRKTCRACCTSFSHRSWCGTTSRSEDRGILSVITEGSLPNL
jgi:hypothetical protein